jgi:hypothetical protein
MINKRIHATVSYDLNASYLLVSNDVVTEISIIKAYW